MRAAQPANRAGNAAQSTDDLSDAARDGDAAGMVRSAAEVAGAFAGGRTADFAAAAVFAHKTRQRHQTSEDDGDSEASDDGNKKSH